MMQNRNIPRFVVSVLMAVVLLVLARTPAGAAPEGTAVRNPPQTVYQARMLALFEQALSPEDFCELQWLIHLGWQFEQDASVRVLTVDGGRPLQYPTLAAAKAAGCLRIKLPVGFDLQGARDFSRSVALLGDSGAARCAYKHLIAVTTLDAAQRLQALTEAGRYVFPELLEIWDSPWFRMRFPTDEWRIHKVPATKKGKAYVANRSAAEAMRAFLDRGANAECYVGQAMCCYTQQYLLYGHEWFDQVWDPLDIWISQPRHIKDSPYGRYTRSEIPYRWRALLLDQQAQRADPALGLAKFGPVAFAGVSGIVMNQVPGVQSNENFVIVSASRRAVDQLVAGGGLPVFLAPANEAWRQMNATSGMFKSRRSKQIAARRIDQIFSTPIFKEILVYVHPYGIVDFATLFKKKMQVADTPTRVVIYTYGREEFCFQRYRAAVKQRFLEARGLGGRIAPQSAIDERPGAMRGPYIPGRSMPGRTQPTAGPRPLAPVQAGARPGVPPRPPPPPMPSREVVPASSDR